MCRRDFHFYSSNNRQINYICSAQTHCAIILPLQFQTCGQPPPVSTRSKSQAPSPPRCSHLRLCASHYFLKHPPPCSSSSRSSRSKQHAAARTHSLAQRVMYSELQLCRLRPLRPPAQRRRPRFTLHKYHVTCASAARSKQQPGQTAARQSKRPHLHQLRRAEGSRRSTMRLHAAADVA